jgi:hypothetical protein
MSQQQEQPEFVKLITAGGLTEADLWKAVLEANGIACHLRSEALAALEPLTIGAYASVDLWVPREEASRALQILQDERVQAPEWEEES